VTTSIRDMVSKSISGLGLCEFDWDGSGGLPMRGDVRDTAYAVFVDEVTLGGLLNSCPPPSITLNSNGTLEVSFDNDGRGLLVTVECEGVLTYVKVFEDDQTTIEGVVRMDMDDFDPDAFVELIELFDWLIQE
jgi:hypothetical protein